MAESQGPEDAYPRIEEIPERLDEQHLITTKTLGFLIHPNIPIPLTPSGPSTPRLKIADIGTGTGIWLLDIANSLPPPSTPSSQHELIGYDITSSAFPPPASYNLPHNSHVRISFQTHDMLTPFPASELGTYDLVAVRFISSATTRSDWRRAVTNLVTLLKPGRGWLQWIDSCNFAVYNTVPGTKRDACREIYEGVQGAFLPSTNESGRDGEVVIGLMMREKGDVRREEVLRGAGLVDVHEDVFSTDRLREAGLGFREKGTRNVIACFLGCLEGLVGVEGSGWTRERVERVREEAMKEIDQGVYHTLDQVCLVGRRAPAASGI